MKDLNFAAHFSLIFFFPFTWLFSSFIEIRYITIENEMIFDTTMNLKKITNFDEVIHAYTRIHGHIKHV